jgi:hypothetical protein
VLRLEQCAIARTSGSQDGNAQSDTSPKQTSLENAQVQGIMTKSAYDVNCALCHFMTFSRDQANERLLSPGQHLLRCIEPIQISQHRERKTPRTEKVLRDIQHFFPRHFFDGCNHFVK